MDHIFDCTDPNALNCAPWCEQCGFNNPGEQDWPGTLIDCSWPPDGYTGAFEWNYYQNPDDIGSSIGCRYDCIDMFDECAPNLDATAHVVPEPTNGSKTKSPAFVPALIHNSGISSGNVAKWAPLYGLTFICHTDLRFRPLPKFSLNFSNVPLIEFVFLECTETLP